MSQLVYFFGSTATTIPSLPNSSDGIRRPQRHRPLRGESSSSSNSDSGDQSTNTNSPPFSYPAAELQHEDLEYYYVEDYYYDNVVESDAGSDHSHSSNLKVSALYLGGGWR